jgi:hypothetical protein
MSITWFQHPAYAAGYKAARFKFKGQRRDGVSLKAQPCQTCRSKDSRDAAPQRGCPALPALSKEELIRLARAVEAGWAAKQGCKDHSDRKSAAA